MLYNETYASNEFLCLYLFLYVHRPHIRRFLLWSCVI